MCPRTPFPKLLEGRQSFLHLSQHYKVSNSTFDIIGAQVMSVELKLTIVKYYVEKTSNM